MKLSRTSELTSRDCCCTRVPRGVEGCDGAGDARGIDSMPLSMRVILLSAARPHQAKGGRGQWGSSSGGGGSGKTLHPMAMRSD